MTIDYQELKGRAGVRSMNKLGEALGMAPNVARGCMSRLAKSGKLPPEQYQEALKEMLEEHGLNGQEYAAEIPEAMDKSAVSEPPEEEPAEAADVQGMADALMRLSANLGGAQEQAGQKSLLLLLLRCGNH